MHLITYIHVHVYYTDSIKLETFMIEGLDSSQILISKLSYKCYIRIGF